MTEWLATLHDMETGTTEADALALFDALPAVRLEEMLGSWRGSGLPTGHPLDGVLEATGWHGKRFDSAEDVHPLVFSGPTGLFSVNPAGLPMTKLTPVVRRLDQKLVAAARPALHLRRTTKPAARLRMVEFRGVVTATMIYDAQPVNDHFRAVDRNTVIGAMDLRGIEPVFMFVLRRETSAI